MTWLRPCMWIDICWRSAYTVCSCWLVYSRTLWYGHFWAPKLWPERSINLVLVSCVERWCATLVVSLEWSVSLYNDILLIQRLNGVVIPLFLPQLPWLYPPADGNWTYAFSFRCEKGNHWTLHIALRWACKTQHLNFLVQTVWYKK